jgi:PLD-like domain
MKKYFAKKTNRLRTIATQSIFLFVCVLQANAFTLPAVQYIPARDYFSTLTAIIDSARSSIIAAVYLFALYPTRSQAKTTQLAGSLVAAQKRGCAVRIMLDKGESSSGVSEDGVNANNRMACEFLRSQGMDIGFADVPAVMHAKAIVIDSSTVIIGSSNWSEAAFEKNTETNALIRSQEFALAALAELGKIKTIAMQDTDTMAARVPLAFMTDTTILARMVSSCSEGLFDMYMYLLRLGYLCPAESALVLDYKPVIHYMAMDSMSPTQSRGLINRYLETLQNGFGLVKFTTHYGRDADIRLVPLPGDNVSVGSSYFRWEWNRELDLSGKVMELFSLYLSSISPQRPKWSLALRSIQKQYGFSQPFIFKGTEELRRKNLLAVEHFPFPKKGEGSRQPDVYTPLPLYDPAALAAKWAELETRYGKEITDRARKYAGIVFMDCDPVAVEKLIGLEKLYGIDKMEQAAKIISAKNVENPTRTLEYFIGIVKKKEG